MKKRWLLSCLFTTSIILTFPAIADANQYEKAVVESPIIDIRLDSNSNSTVISKISKGQEILIVGEENGWTKIKLGTGIEGFIESSDSQIKKIEDGFITNKGVNLRRNATTESEAIHILNTGDKVEIIEKSGQWTKVRLNSLIGYVHSDYISSDLNKSATVSRGASRDIDSLIEVAKSKLGTPYNYGSSGPNSFDCSGFVSYSYKTSLGIDLPRTSTSQSKQGTQVSKDELQTGDIVYFDTGGGLDRVNHVGIYLSDGEFIHASSGRNMKVMISSLDEKHYRNSYMGATRIIE